MGYNYQEIKLQKSLCKHVLYFKCLLIFDKTNKHKKKKIDFPYYGITLNTRNSVTAVCGQVGKNGLDTR